MSNETADIRILSVLQPFAILVAAGFKPVENRRKPVPSTVPLPARVGIHASKRHDGNMFRRALIWASSAMTGDGEPGNTMEWIHGWWANRDAGYGVLLGWATLVDCHHADECTAELGSLCDPWAERHVYHYVFRDPAMLGKPVPMKGALGFWRAPAEHSDLVTANAASSGQSPSTEEQT